MFTMLQSALASASEYNGLNALAAARLRHAVCGIPPWLGDISFQLSFAAVAANPSMGRTPLPPAPHPGGGR